MNTPRGAALHIEEASMIPIVSTVLEFEKKKFWIALFSMMARREGTKANATSQPFGPFVASCGEWHNSKPHALLSEMVQHFFGVANDQVKSGGRMVVMEANENPRAQNISPQLCWPPESESHSLPGSDPAPAKSVPVRQRRLELFPEDGRLARLKRLHWMSV